MKVVDPITLEMKDLDEKEYVYILTDETCYDYEQNVSVEVFKGFDRALDKFKQKVTEAKKDMKEWVDEDDIEEEQSIDSSKEHALYEIYEDGDFSRVHNVIKITKGEVK